MSNIYKSPYQAYPFLSDVPTDLRCDFEIMTDEIASLIGLLHATVCDQTLKDQLIKACELVYHMNPSLRTFVSLTPDEFQWLETCTLDLQDQMRDRYDQFVLTQGCAPACQAHVIRVKFKALVRLLYRHVYQGSDVSNLLFDFANLFSNYFFLLALKLNALNGTDEVAYVSRNYK